MSSNTKRKANDTELLKSALLNVDWGQVIANGGPPCFHLDGDKLCFRAKRWPGHDGGSMHQFVSLHEFIEELSNPIAAAKLSQGD
ncbi:MAG: hypothetical protein JWO78_312 [Micavibrio sp.]|nr:hypothetical protein [Micavibrio sp.]